MKLAVSSYSFASAIAEGKMTYDEIIPRAKELGFEGVEFAGITVSEGQTGTEHAKALSEKAKECGIEITCYSTSGNFATGDIGKEIKRLKGEVDIAEALGAKLMRHDVHYGPDKEKCGEKSFDNLLERLIKGARAVTEYAEKKGVKTMVENHGFYCQDSERVEKLVDGVGHKNYGALVDLGNFLCADEEPGKAVGNLKNYVFYVHCKDFYFRDGSMSRPDSAGWITTRGGNLIKGAPIGDGVVPVGKCLRILKDSGYDGWITVEYEGREDAIESIEAGRKHLEKTIACL